MKGFWFGVGLVALTLWLGCSERTPEDLQNLEQNVPAATPGTADQAVQPALPQEARPITVPSSKRDASADRAASTAPVPSRPATGTAATAARLPAPAPSAPREPAPQVREVTVAANTPLPLELMTALSSETAKVETPVRARLREAVVVDGYTALPAGAVLTGSVIDVARAGRVQGRSRLSLRFTEVDLDGVREELRTNPLTFEGEATKGEDATKIGAGAVGGAIVGGILGGGSGAAKGAAIGGAAGTGVVLATRGRDVELSTGADLAATLASPFTVQAEIR